MGSKNMGDALEITDFKGDEPKYEFIDGQIFLLRSPSSNHIVIPNGVIEIYYLTGNHYELHDSLVYENQKTLREDERDVWGDVLTLREFPNVNIKFSDVFKMVLEHE